MTFTLFSVSFSWFMPFTKKREIFPDKDKNCRTVGKLPSWRFFAASASVVVQRWIKNRPMREFWLTSLHNGKMIVDEKAFELSWKWWVELQQIVNPSTWLTLTRVKVTTKHHNLKAEMHARSFAAAACPSNVSQNFKLNFTSAFHNPINHSTFLWFH